MKLDKFQLLFFGSDSFSVRILTHLLDRRVCRIRVVTGKGSLLDQFSVKNQLDRYRWPLELTRYPFNIGLVASFGHLIDTKTIQRFQYGLFNVHPSLLPKYRGSTPVQTAILEGVQATGCTIMRIPPVEKFDIGEILLQEKVKIYEREYATSLRDRLADLGAKMAENLLLNYDTCLLNARAQGDRDKSYARKIKPEQALLKFRSQDSDLIDRTIRAYSGFVDVHISCLGGLMVRLDGLRDPHETNSYLNDGILVQLREIDREDQVQPGMMYFHKVRRVLCIKCADNRWLAFDFATPRSKPKMSALDFYNGYISKLNDAEALPMTDL